MGGVKEQVLLDLQLYNYTIILYGGIDRGSELVKGENENENEVRTLWRRRRR